MASVVKEKHPPGLFVLFFTEMWERFGFYSMLAMFTLYLKDEKRGFGWSAEDATSLYANYLMFVYASPLLGGWIADKKLGYRNSVLLGGVVFMAGYFLLAVPQIWAVYLALTCLVIGNGFFKPNVSAMVGKLYPEGSHLKDRAYNIFYMGINIGALMAPINAEIWVDKIGFNNAFAIAGGGMIISIAILWFFKQHVDHVPEPLPQSTAEGGAAKANLMEAVPEATRIIALIVIFLIIIVFWMVFHQNGSTLTYWADDNTDWQVSGIIANAINPFWVVTLTFPVVWMWHWLGSKGLEPSIPGKMMLGMFLCAASFGILYLSARQGENQEITSEMLAEGNFRVTDRTLGYLKEKEVPAEILEDLNRKGEDGKPLIKGKKFASDMKFADALGTIKQEFEEAVKQAKSDLSQHRNADKVQQAMVQRAERFLLQARASQAPPEFVRQSEASLEQGRALLAGHRKNENALKERLERLEKDAKLLKDLKIAEGELPALNRRDKAGMQPFVSALEEAMTEVKDLSFEGVDRLEQAKSQRFTGQEKFENALARPTVLGPENATKHGPIIQRHSYLFRVSPFWLILAYAVMTLGELMLSPMGLSLVSKVAPVRLRGIMMGCWFVATAIGNKLTMIGVYWERWDQSSFFLLLGGMAASMGVVLVVLLKPLNRAMPGV